MNEYLNELMGKVAELSPKCDDSDKTTLQYNMMTFISKLDQSLIRSKYYITYRLTQDVGEPLWADEFFHMSLHWHNRKINFDMCIMMFSQRAEDGSFDPEYDPNIFSISYSDDHHYHSTSIEYLDIRNGIPNRFYDLYKRLLD